MALERVDPELSRAESGRLGRGSRLDGTVVAAIALSGAVGALARYGLVVALPPSTSGFPLATLLTNLSGALAIGVVLAVLTERFSSSRFARPVVVTGLLGGYTTFSTFMVDADSLVRAHAIGTAIAYVLVSAVAGPVLAVFGLSMARARLRGSARRDVA